MKKTLLLPTLFVLAALSLQAQTVSNLRTAFTDKAEARKSAVQCVWIGGVCWATHNLKAHGEFVDNPEDYGALFQWGRRGDGHEQRTSTRYPNDNDDWEDGVVSGVGNFDANGQIVSSHAAFGKFIKQIVFPYDWRDPQDNFLWNSSTASNPVKTVNDPCPPGWRMPTETELNALATLPTSQRVWTTNWNGTGINGYVFGTVPETIFLPAAGCRGISSGSLLGVGTDGYYWSSTVSGASARHLNFYSGFVYTNPNARATGLSVRCVTLCPPTFDTINLDSCDQITYNSMVFFKDTIFTDTLVNAAGCDSLLTVNLTIYPSYAHQQDLFGYDSLEFMSRYYYSDTILTHAYQTSNGCDSVVETHIFVSLPPNIVVYWHRILAVPNWRNLDEFRYATYYWYKDDALLPQSNKDHIEVGSPIPAGKYNVSVHYGGMEILYLERIFERPFGISAYPNPLHIAEELIIESVGNAIRRVEVFDANGVLQKIPIRLGTGVGAYCIRPANDCDQCQQGVCNTPLRISGFKNPGMYILKIHFDDHTVETLKIIVK
ncbi:MAG: hypothetical protein FWG79_07170 [Bacteroidales bacterium]|nr:hypothetical protein [Bacteroidales bacterium]